MKSERIMILDDDLNHLEKMSTHLRSAGFEVTTNPGTEDALKHILKGDFDLSLIKYKMGDIYGLNILRQAQKEGSKSSFIIMGDSLNIKQTIEIIEEGAYSILLLPYEADDLKKVVARGVKNKRAFMEILQLSDNLVEANNDLKDKKKRLEDEQKQLKLKVEELDFLNKLSFLMSSSLNPEKIIDSLAVNLKETIPFDIFSAMMVDGKEIFLKVHSSNQIEKDLLEDINLNIHKSFVRYTGKSIENNMPNKTPSNSRKVVRMRCGSDLDFNLQVAGKKLGVLKIIRFSNEPFKVDQKSLLTTVSNQLALFLNNALEHKKYLGLASHDSLTNALNRRTFDDVIEREFNRAYRYSSPLSLLMIDLDNFKKVNDCWGHQAGDVVLKDVSKRICQCLRESDIFARYGGEEFAAILPETDINSASILAERIREEIEAVPVETPEGKISVTLSMGIATYPFNNIEDKNELIKMADDALYKAKGNGRNRVYILSKDKEFREIKVKSKDLRQKRVANF